MSSISVDNYPSLSTAKNEGYLSLSSKPDLVSLKVQEAPFPFMFTGLDRSKNEGYPSFETLMSLPGTLIQKAPFPAMMPGLDNDKNEGYLSFSTLESLPGQLVQWFPFPRMMPVLDMYKNEGYPSFPLLPSLTRMIVQEAPFPRMMPGLIQNHYEYGTINEGYPCLGYPFFSDISKKLTQWKPYPKMLPSVEDDIAEGYPSLRLEGPYWGAFSYSGTNEVEIPKSVMYICDYAFWNTEIKSVKINKHCIYFRHSFPPGCHIKPYKDDE